jgi:hypothetical protein
MLSVVYYHPWWSVLYREVEGIQSFLRSVLEYVQASVYRLFQITVPDLSIVSDLIKCIRLQYHSVSENGVKEILGKEERKKT